MRTAFTRWWLSARTAVGLLRLDKEILRSPASSWGKDPKVVVSKSTRRIRRIMKVAMPCVNSLDLDANPAVRVCSRKIDLLHLQHLGYLWRSISIQHLRIRRMARFFQFVP